MRARSEEALSARLRECVDDMAGVVDDIVSLRTSHRETTTTLLLPSSYGRYAYTVMPSPHVPQVSDLHYWTLAWIDGTGVQG